MGLKKIINNSLKTAIIAGSMFIASSSYGQKPLKKILKKYDTDTMSFDVKNVILLEQKFGVKKPKGFDELYQKFIDEVPTKSEIDSATKDMNEIKKAEYIFRSVGDALNTIKTKNNRIRSFVLTEVYENKIANDCDGFSTFYASGIEKIYETKLDSTPFRFIRLDNHVYLGYEKENKIIFTWEATVNKHQTDEQYAIRIPDKKANKEILNSKEMWSSTFYTFAICTYLKNKNKSKEYFDKAKEILSTQGKKSNYFNQKYIEMYESNKYN